MSVQNDLPNDGHKWPKHVLKYNPVQIIQLIHELCWRKLGV
jgi:hypothetical protein